MGRQRSGKVVDIDLTVTPFRLFFGKVVRIDMRDFKKLADKQQEHAATLAE